MRQNAMQSNPMVERLQRRVLTPQTGRDLMTGWRIQSHSSTAAFPWKSKHNRNRTVALHRNCGKASGMIHDTCTYNTKLTGKFNAKV